MQLSRLEIHNLRNISQLSLVLDPQMNVFYGDNGSGKTSILEAIHLLALGRSFRTHLLNTVIQHAQVKCSVFGVVQAAESSPIPLGIEKNLRGETKIKINGHDAPSIAHLARMVPVLLLDAQVSDILKEGPEARRHYLHWGMFHVEHSFFPLWKTYHQSLKQRNAALRAGDRALVKSWDETLVVSGVKLHELRQQHLNLLLPLIRAVVADFLDIRDVQVKYLAGWNSEQHFQETLAANLEKDLYMGYTTGGPHRFDLQITLGGCLVQQLLSQGQQKSLASALRLAQGLLLHQETKQNCIYLIDDFAAELDQEHCQKLADILLATAAQVFVTGVELSPLKPLLQGKEVGMFHVEHGTILGDQKHGCQTTEIIS